MKYTKKTNYTQEQLRDALVCLLEKEPFEKITINQLVDYCHLNRSTFYRYYDDKYDLLQKIEEELVTELDNRRPIAIKLDQLTGALQGELFASGVKYYEEHCRQFRALLGPNCDRSFESRLRQCFNRRYQVVVEGIDDQQVELVRQMVISMIIEGLKYWLNTPEVTIEDLGKVLRAMLVEGPLTYLQSLKKRETQ